MTCIARGHVSLAERNKSLARSSSWRAAGERHVNGALDTNTHKATYNKNKRQTVSQFLHGVNNIDTTKALTYPRRYSGSERRGRTMNISQLRQKGCQINATEINSQLLRKRSTSTQVYGTLSVVHADKGHGRLQSFAKHSGKRRRLMGRIYVFY